MFWRLWPRNGLKWKFSLQTISGLTHKERERESLRLRLRLHRLRRSQPLTSTSSIYESIDLRIDHAFNFIDHAFDFADFANHAFNFTDLRPRAFDPRTFDFAGDPEPSRHELIFDPSPSTQSHEPTNRSPSLCVILIFCVILIDPRTHEPLISDFFLLLWWCGWWCFGGFPVVWWWVLCGWWWKIAFLECYQTHENIFQNNFHNTTKHLKIFSFPENSISEKYFTWTKHSQSFQFVKAFPVLLDLRVHVVCSLERTYFLPQ